MKRRSFIERLGLGAGALWLGPLGASLVNEARGQSSARKRVVFLVGGNGIHPDLLFTPPEVRALDAKLSAPVTPGLRDFTWPKMLESVARHRARMLLIDGLSNQQPTSMHSAGYGALSCFTAANNAQNDYFGPPGNITIDQFIANVIGKTTPFKSILAGVGWPKLVFASAAERPEPAVTSPRRLWRTLFGALSSADAGAAGPPSALALRQRALFDVHREDLRRLERALAGAEKRKLEHYLSAIEALDARSRAVAALQACNAPSAPAERLDEANAPPEDTLESLVDMATVALLCGMTNVVGISAGCGNPHWSFPKYRRALINAGLDPSKADWTYGHAPGEIQGPGMTAVWSFLAGLLGRMADALEQVKEGDRTVFDNTVMVMLSDNAEAHHASHHRWPLVVFGNAGGALRADGRFLRYAPKSTTATSAGSNRDAPWRSLADFYCTIAHAVGAPTDAFGKGGNEPVRGPLAELLA